MKKILITGGSGLLGSNLAIRLRKKYDVAILINNRKVKIPEVKVLDGKNFFQNKCDNFIPDLIINTVALTNVELCEDNPYLAFETNVNYLKLLNLISKGKKTKLLQISTDHLSDGLNALCKEDDLVKPLNEYARTKLSAEHFIQNEIPNSIIVRTNFFGWGPIYRNSFSDTIINNIFQKKELFLFEDTFFSPVSIRRLCEIIIRLFKSGTSGIYNVSSNDRISKFEFGLKICEYFNLEKKYIIPSKIGDNKKLVKRPQDTSLDNHKVSNFLKIDCGFVSNNINDLDYDIKDGIKNTLMNL